MAKYNVNSNYTRNTDFIGDNHSVESVQKNLVGPKYNHEYQDRNTGQSDLETGKIESRYSDESSIRNTDQSFITKNNQNIYDKDNILKSNIIGNYDLDNKAK